MLIFSVSFQIDQMPRRARKERREPSKKREGGCPYIPNSAGPCTSAIFTRSLPHSPLRIHQRWGRGLWRCSLSPPLTTFHSRPLPYRQASADPSARAAPPCPLRKRSIPSRSCTVASARTVRTTTPLRHRAARPTDSGDMARMRLLILLSLLAALASACECALHRCCWRSRAPLFPRSTGQE